MDIYEVRMTYKNYIETRNEVKFFFGSYESEAEIQEIWL